jgi:hypothetical protein
MLEAWAHPMAWHHIQNTGILEKHNLHVQTVCSLLVRLNMNNYILCAMAYDKLAKPPLYPTDTLTQNTT